MNMVSVCSIQCCKAMLTFSKPGFYSYETPEDSQSDPSVSNTSYWYVAVSRLVQDRSDVLLALRGAALVEAVKNGSVPLTRVQDMVTRSAS